MSVKENSIIKIENILIEYIDDAIFSHVDIVEIKDTPDYLISLYYRKDETANSKIDGSEYIRLKTLRRIKNEIKAKLEKHKYEVKAIDILTKDDYMPIIVKKLL